MPVNLSREDFINQYPPLNLLNKKDVKGVWDREELHLYVHIPFCVEKCSFCYYKSFKMQNPGTIDEYLDALKTEITMYSNLPEVQSKRIRSIYFGGGTPTLLNEQQLESLITHIKSSFAFTDNMEFCCEARPGPETTFNKLKLLKEHGMFRLSLGCQSLNDEVLRINGRTHDSTVFYETFDKARQAGIDSINVDLMSGLISDTMETWISTIKSLISLKPENIAIYKMEVYLNNKIYQKMREDKIELISNIEEANLARMAYKELISSGYMFADNFSFMTDPKYDHAHRREVWKGADMIGVGLSSHSCFNDYIYQNESSFPVYMNRVREGVIPIQRAYKISAREEMIQRIIFGVKNLNFSRSCFEDEFGIDVLDVFPKQFKYLEEEGFITIDTDNIKTTFEGALYADDIVREFYLPDQKNVMLGHVHRPEK